MKSKLLRQILSEPNGLKADTTVRQANAKTAHIWGNTLLACAKDTHRIFRAAAAALFCVFKCTFKQVFQGNLCC